MPSAKEDGLAREVEGDHRDDPRCLPFAAPCQPVCVVEEDHVASDRHRKLGRVSKRRPQRVEPDVAGGNRPRRTEERLARPEEALTRRAGQHAHNVADGEGHVRDE